MLRDGRVSYWLDALLALGWDIVHFLIVQHVGAVAASMLGNANSVATIVLAVPLNSTQLNSTQLRQRGADSTCARDQRALCVSVPRPAGP